MPRVSVRIVSDLPPTVAVAVVTVGVACTPELPTLLAAPHPAATSAAIMQTPIIAADTARFMRFLLPNGRIADHLLPTEYYALRYKSLTSQTEVSRRIPHPRYSGVRTAM